jgi:orotidine-5'-phosphate decarboxylase
MTSQRARLCVALDSSDESRILELAAATGPFVDVLKIGLTTFASLGPGIVDKIGQLRPVFLDLKLNDIPAQVGGATRAIRELGVAFTTVHALGGAEMIAAAVDEAHETTVLAVTVLTSLDDAALDRLGIVGGAAGAVVRLAEVALEAGAGGLVCSPLEVAALRVHFGPNRAGGPLIVVPGIRPRGAADYDQKRATTPRDALAAGADLLVVGRPITAAPDPASAARAIRAEIDGADPS